MIIIKIRLFLWEWSSRLTTASVRHTCSVSKFALEIAESRVFTIYSNLCIYVCAHIDIHTTSIGLQVGLLTCIHISCHHICLYIYTNEQNSVGVHSCFYCLNVYLHMYEYVANSLMQVCICQENVWTASCKLWGVLQKTKTKKC